MHTYILFVGLAVAASWWPTLAWARLGSKLDHQTFRERCEAYRHLNRQNLDRVPPVGSVDYYPTGSVEAGQTRFSFKHLRKAMRKAIKERKGAYFDKHLDTWIFAHDDRRSAFSRERAAGAVYYKGRLYLFDGHHKALISTYLRAPRLPIKIEANWSHLSEEEFFARMRQGPYHYAHWQNHLGERVDPVDLCALDNDPNLLLARYLLVRVDAHLDPEGRLILENPRGAERPIAIKINNDIPFYEFEIADALRRHGVNFDERRRETDLTSRERRDYMTFLRFERDRPGSRLNRILLLDVPKTFDKLNLPRLISDHVTKVDCHDFLHARTKTED